MKNFFAMILAAGWISLATACTTADKSAVPADTATGQSTTIATPTSAVPDTGAMPPASPAPASAPVSRGPAAATGRPKSTTTSPKPAPQPTLHDSAFKPRATVDDKGNVQPIKRDSLK